MERRLAAILAADVVGYSRLIRADEEGTLAALKALRAELIDPRLAEHNGRIVKLMGDGMLVEFASAVDAVAAAVDTQQAMAEHNAGQTDGKRIAFTSERSGNKDMWVVPAAGGEPRQLTIAPGRDLWMNFSPDGRRIAYTA